jgi:Mg2+-importing ATPase
VFSLAELATASADESLSKLGSGPEGLTSEEAQARLLQFGPNAIHTQHFTIWTLLLGQFKNPILILLASAGALSAVLGDASNALVLALILSMSVALSLATEYRAEKASADLQKRTTHRATVVRDGVASQVDVTQLVPGDVVKLTLGAVVPADIRVIEAKDFECDESIITGESMPVIKSELAVSKTADGTTPANTALMGTVVRSGSATGLVVLTGGSSEFGVIAQRLSERVPETDFQRGLRKFSVFLLRIAIVQAVLIVAVSAILRHNLVEAVLFALALAVGMTPQLLPAIVSTALAFGSRELAKVGVLVKRLVSIEDLGDLDVLVTDKTGTLTAGAVAFESAVPLGPQTGNTGASSQTSPAFSPLTLGLLATDASYADAAKSTAGLNALDAALWASGAATFDQSVVRLDSIAFDHDRRIASALVIIDGKPTLVAKGSPEDLMARCIDVDPSAAHTLSKLYQAGARVVAVATRQLDDRKTITPADEAALTLRGFLTFADPAKPDVGESLKALANLGIEVKIATGDSAEVAVTVCQAVGLVVSGVLTGGQIDAMSDEALAKAVVDTTIFARVSPEQKARILRALRTDGKAVGFLGDGVNDAIALHDADVGISVDTATDVAKDAADVVLLEKDLAVLAAGVRQGRRVFSNTMKYVLMGTAGDFGNMVSAAVGSMILPFLPMAAGQVLLQDLMYDSSQLTIPADNVDPEQTARPSHWQIRFIAKFMLVFGLASSVFDFTTFALMLFVFHAKVSEFQTGWFIESLSTATLIVFAIRTRRVPFFRSRPALALVASVLSVIAVGVAITYLPIGTLLGFSPLPADFFLALLGMIAAYLVLVELAKRKLFRTPPMEPNRYHRGSDHRVNRRASKFVTHKPKVTHR